VDRTTWIRTYAFRKDGGAWRIWHEGVAIEELARALAAADTDQQRLSLLDADSDLVNDDLRSAVGRLALASSPRGGTRGGANTQAADPLPLLNLAVVIAERIGSPASVGAAWADIGLHHEGAGDFPAALAAFSKALVAFRSAGNAGRAASTEMNCASACYRLASLARVERERQRLYAEAADHYKAALDGFASVGETGWNASILHSLGNASYLLGRWDEALEYYRRTLALQEQAEAVAGQGRATPQTRGVAAAHQAIGMVLKEQGDYPSAIEAFTKALEKFGSCDDKSGAANVQRQIGETLRQDGVFTLAVQHFLSALDIAKSIRADARDKANEARILASIGEIYSLEQRYTAALDYFQKSLDTLPASEREALAGILGGIGGVHFMLAEFAPAIDFFTRSLEIRQDLQDERGVAFTLARMGLVRLAEDKPADAQAAFQKSLDAATAAGDAEAEAVALTLLASAAVAAGRPDDALDLAGRAATRADTAGSLDVLAHAKLVTGDACRARGDLPAAEAAVRNAVITVERIRSAGIRADERFFNDTIAPYTALVHLLVRQGRPADAFAMLERARQVRMQALLDDAPVATGLTTDQREQERTLRKRVTALRTQLTKARGQAEPDANKVAWLSTALSDATAARKDFETALYQAHPELAELRARKEADPLPVAVASLLDRTSVLLEYAVAETATHLFVIEPPEPTTGAGSRPPAVESPAATQVRVYTIDIASSRLAKQVTEFRALLASPQSDVTSAATALHNLLVAPAAAQLAGKKRIVIVPDGALWSLPFQALRSGSGRYVIEDAAVAYGPSLSALAASVRRGQGPREAGRLRAVSVGLSDAGQAASAALALARPDLKQTPAHQAEVEARAVGLLFPAGLARTRVGAAATADRVRDDAESAGVLHLAVPGILVDASPLHSFLVFAPAAQAGPASRLPRAVTAPAWPLVEFDDLMGWNAGARVVVMSRVQGDPGAQSAGAATRALAWAWVVAGVPTTVVSQWVVDAPSTTTLMQGLHRRLAPVAGAPRRASEALRLATLPLLTGASRHPYYWAGFTVMGQ
jgi:CHAT domain-containing protein